MMKRFLKLITPPILWEAVKSLQRQLRSSENAVRSNSQVHGEKSAKWYDEHLADRFLVHYSRTQYYCFWTVILDRLLRSGVSTVLDIGCGTGQFAGLLRDQGLTGYCGFDFSRKRVEVAKAAVPEFSFVVANAYETDLYTSFPCDAVVCTEFLEHIEGDLVVLSKISPGVRFYGSIPNFASSSHVRFFKNRKDVEERYGGFFKDFSVMAFPVSDHVFFLFEGVKI